MSAAVPYYLQKTTRAIPDMGNWLSWPFIVEGNWVTMTLLPFANDALMMQLHREGSGLCFCSRDTWTYPEPLQSLLNEISRSLIFIHLYKTTGFIL